VSKYLTEAAIPGASTHALRHTFTTHHVRKGTKLDIVRIRSCRQPFWAGRRISTTTPADMPATMARR
jgi:hypothetical protein